MTGGAPRTNPYVGIRPFFDEDAIFFFGRREQTRELLACLRESRFLTVLGSSGSGKSSLVRSGLIPTLQAGFLVAARTGWRMAKSRPGDAPLENLAEALLRAAGKPRTPEAIDAFAEELRERHLAAALELLQPVVEPDENVLVLMDQFEELFAFRAGAGTDTTDDATARNPHRNAERIRRLGEASSVVSLLLALAEQKVVPVYIVLTMRTDFLGDTDLFAGLPEEINRAGYLVPRLTRSQLREAIEGPARLMGARVEPRLVDRLVNDVGDRGDRLPLLQHALHRAWNAWDTEGRIGPLDLVHLERVGGLDHALDQEGEEVIGGTPLAVAERIFKRLTDTDPQKRRVRRPARRSELLSVADTDAKTVDDLLARCAREGTNFVFASADGTPEDPRYSIAHESLIRQWDRLRRWVDEEQNLRDWYLGIAREAATWRADRTLPLLSPQATRVAQDMLRLRAPTEAWAARYPEAAASFREVTAFIHESHEHNERARRQRRTLIASLAAVLVVSTLFVAWSGLKAKNALANAEALGRKAAIARLVDEDPTYAYALAAEFDTTKAWDAERIELVQRVLGQPAAIAEFQAVSAMDISHDGSRVAVLYYTGEVEVRSADGSGDPLAHFEAAKATTVQFDSVGNVWTLSDQPGEVLRWSGTRGTAEHIGVPTRAPLLGVTLGVDGQWAYAVDSLGAVFAGRTTDQRLAKVAEPDTNRAYAMRHPLRDDLLFLAQKNGVLHLLNITTGRRLATLEASAGNRIPAELITMSRDGRKVLVARNGAGPDLFTLSADLRTVVRTETWKGSAPQSAALSPDGEVVAVGFPSGRIALHRGVSRDTVWRRETADEAPSVQFTPDGNWVIVTSAYGTVRLIKRDEPAVDLFMPGHRAALGPALASRDGRLLLTLDANGIARVWSPWQRADRRGLPVVWPKGTEVQLSKNGERLIASSPGGVVTAYPLDSADAFAARREISLGPSKSAPTILALSAGGDAVLLSAPSTGVVVWRLGRELEPITTLPRDLTAAAFLPDGTGVVVADGDSTITVHEIGEGRRRPWIFRGAYTSSAKLTADGKQVVFFDWTMLLRGDLQTGSVDTLAAWEDPIVEEPLIAVSPDNRYTLLGFLMSPSVLHDAAEPNSPQDFLFAVQAAAFSPAGDRLVTVPRDLELSAHSFSTEPTSTALQRLTGFRRLVTEVSFSPDGTRLLTTSEGGDVQVWTVGDSVRLQLSLHHAPRLPYSDFFVSAQSVSVRENREIRSVVSVPDSPPRVRIWSLTPGEMQRQLRAATTACPMVESRQRVLASELRDDAERRAEACLTRASERRPTPR